MFMQNKQYWFSFTFCETGWLMWGHLGADGFSFQGIIIHSHFWTSNTVMLFPHCTAFPIMFYSNNVLLPGYTFINHKINKEITCLKYSLNLSSIT